MNRPNAFALMSCLVALLATCRCPAIAVSAPGGKVAKHLEADSAVSRASLPPAAVQKLTRSVTRSAMLTSLLSNANTKSLLVNYASGFGVAESQLPTLATKPLSPPSVQAAAGVREAEQAAAEAEYRNLNWSSGLTFSACSVPTYHGGRYHVGDLIVSQAAIITSQPGVVWISHPTPRRDDISVYLDISLDLELPPGNAVYMIAIKMTRQDGVCPPNMVGGYSAGSTSAYRAHLTYYTNAQDTAEMPVSFGPLSDGSGYVGVFSVNPARRTTTYWHPTMRSTNAIFRLYYFPSSAVADQSNRVIFSSITITRL